MAQFQFRLATLLRIRELARDERRTYLAEALRRVDELRAKCAEIDHLLHDTQRLQAPPGGELNVDRLLNATRYELVLRAEQRSLKLQEAALAGEVEKRRQALVAANRDVRSLELLREKQTQRQREQEEDWARKEIDEVAVRRYVGEDSG
jgi:flagellar FliJ protein